MSVRAAPHAGASAPAQPYYDEESGSGWVTFSGVLLLILGTLNIIDGIAAVGNAHFFVANTHYIAGDLNAWGWTILCLGAIQLAAGFGVFARNQLSRWLGVAVLGLNAIAQLFFMPAYPLWSLSIFALDIVALYGLVAYGKRIA